MVFDRLVQMLETRMGVPEYNQCNYICNTRNLSKTVWDIFSSRSAVIGAGAQMASLASTWIQWGLNY